MMYLSGIILLSGYGLLLLVLSGAMYWEEYSLKGLRNEKNTSWKIYQDSRFLSSSWSYQFRQAARNKRPIQSGPENIYKGIHRVKMPSKIKLNLNSNVRICENPGCYRRATEHHHLFSDSKQNRRLYGKTLDNDLNILLLCYDCHHNKPLRKLTEIEFCNKLNIDVESKVLKSKKIFNEVWYEIHKKRTGRSACKHIER